MAEEAVPQDAVKPPQEAANPVASRPVYDDPEESLEVPDPTPRASSTPPPVPTEPAEAVRETTPKDPATGRFVKKSHPESLLRRADDFAIPEAHRDEMTTDELEHVVYHLERQAIAERRHDARTTELDSRVPQEEREPTVEWGNDEEGKPLSEQDVHPALANVVKTLTKRIDQLEKQLGGMRSAQVFDEYDKGFMALGSKWTKHFGDGTRESLDPNGRELKKRIAVLREVSADKSRNSISRKIAKAAHELFGEPEEAPPARREPVRDEELEQRQDAWDRGTVQRPTQRRTKEPEGKEAAYDYARAWLNQNGGSASGNGKGKDLYDD